MNGISNELDCCLLCCLLETWTLECLPIHAFYLPMTTIEISASTSYRLSALQNYSPKPIRRRVIAKRYVW
jgi:hypothetical protein